MNSSSSSSFDALESAIYELDQQLKTNALQISGWFSHLNNLLHDLHFWAYLRTVLIFIHKSCETDEVIQILGSLPLKVEGAFHDITLDLNIACQKQYNPQYPSKLYDVFRQSGEKIKLFKQEIGAALDHLSSCSLILHSSSLDFSLWFKFIFSVEGILYEVSNASDSFKEQKAISLFKRDIKSLQHFLHGVIDFEYGFPSDPMINSFLIHVTSVAVRIANWCLQYWIMKGNSVDKNSKIFQLQDLQRRIDPTTSEVLELNLKFVRALNKICHGPAEYFADSLLFFLLAIKDPYVGNLFVEERRYDILMELRSKSDMQFGILMGLRGLIIFTINQPEECSEDVQIILDEIKPLLIEAGPLFASKSGHPSSELHINICLLKLELFLKEQLKGSMIFIEGQFEGLKEVLINLNYQSSALVAEVYREVSSLYQFCRDNNIREAKARISLFILLLKILFFKVESCRMELLKGNESCVSLAKEQIETLLEGLKWFAALVINQQVENEEHVEVILTRIEAVTTRVRCLHHSSLHNKITEEMIKKTILSFSDLLDNLTLVKPELRNFHPQIQRPNFPKTDGMGFIDYLLGSIWELLKHDPDSIALVKHHIEEIHSGLKLLKSSLRNILEPINGHLELQDLDTRITNVAYEVEYVIDSVEVGIGVNWQYVLWLYDLLEQIRLINMKVTNSYEDKTGYATAQTVNQIPRQMVSQAGNPQINEEVVCLNDQEEDTIDRVTRGSLQRDIVCIIGMPGIGKTTLAKKVYNDPNITHHFHVRAWCSVSQVYKKRKILLDILGNFSGLTDNMHQMMDEDLELKLYQHLKLKRYLVVMDDVWDIEAWRDLESSLPNDGNGSRILMTSRLSDMALKVKPDSYPLCLRLLSEDESWKLLQMKILHGGCPEELQEVGKKIAKKCEGLPLAIVAVAGLLARIEKKQDQWGNIAETLSSKINDDPQSRCKDILQLSYNHLPDCLKACFLYMGAFMKDKDIPVWKLIRLWIAEGFIQGTEMKSSEDLAEEYLMDLIGRNLVIVSKRKSIGRVKTCCIHDILRDLCLKKANEENFLQLITRYDEPYASYDDLDYGIDSYDYYHINPVTYERHRLSFCLKRKHFVKSRPSASCTRSLMFFPTTDTYPRHPYDISFITHNFKLLKVLDLENINMGFCFPTGIELLLQLRYLAVSGDIDSIPHSIAKLWKLETLIMKGLKDDKIILPYTIWYMARLRHVHLNNHAFFSLQEDKLGDSCQLNNLVTFSTLSFSPGKDIDVILLRLPNLRKLGCIFLESEGSMTNCNKFPELEVLTLLESLKIVYIGRPLTSGNFNLPLTLKELTLSNFRLPWDHISAIGRRLRNLKVLKLLSRAFEGQIWDMKEGEFRKLKYLKLDSLNIARWNATNDHLPNLEQLVVRNCKNLEEVPYSLGEITTLQMIEVQLCGKSVEESVKRIGKEGLIEGLKILVNQRIHA